MSHCYIKIRPGVTREASQVKSMAGNLSCRLRRLRRLTFRNSIQANFSSSLWQRGTSARVRTMQHQAIAQGGRVTG